MGKIFWQISTTLDGFMEGPGGDLSRTAEVVDDDFQAYASSMLDDISSFVIGRRTYETFVAYWPGQSGHDADRLNSLPKLVASRTLEAAEWNNARIVGEDLTGELARLKAASPGDVAIFGSSTLAASVFDLIDEIRVFVTPSVIGSGAPAFRGVAGKHDLKLSNSQTWSSGTVALFYSR